MRKLLFILLTFSFTVSIFAQNRKIIKVGINKSDFINEDATAKNKPIFGLGYEHSFSKHIGLAGEILYLTKRSIINNKAIGSYFDNPPQGHYYDIDISLKFIEIPILLTVKKQIMENMNIRFYIGPSLAIQINENTKYKQLKKCLPEEPNGCQLDYLWSEGEGCFFLYNSGLVSNYGISLDWQFLEISFRYSRDIHDIGCIKGIFLHKRLQSFKVFVGFIF